MSPWEAEGNGVRAPASVVLRGGVEKDPVSIFAMYSGYVASAPANTASNGSPNLLAKSLMKGFFPGRKCGIWFFGFGTSIAYSQLYSQFWLPRSMSTNSSLVTYDSVK